MPLGTFTLAAVLSLPKQFATVYVGVALDKSSSGMSHLHALVYDSSVLVDNFYFYRRPLQKVQHDKYRGNSGHGCYYHPLHAFHQPPS